MADDKRFERIEEALRDLLAVLGTPGHGHDAEERDFFGDIAKRLYPPKPEPTAFQEYLGLSPSCTDKGLWNAAIAAAYQCPGFKQIKALKEP